MDNTVINSALDALNATSLKVAQDQAVCLINQVKSLDNQKDSNKMQMASYQAELLRVAVTEITVESILGTTAPTNSNTETLTRTVKALNEGRQCAVAQTTNRLAHAIQGLVDANAEIDKQRAELVAKLVAIKPAVVSAATVIGS